MASAESVSLKAEMIEMIALPVGALLQQGQSSMTEIQCRAACAWSLCHPDCDFAG